MIDVQLPRPLMEPSAWPKAGLVSIAQCPMGGPIDELWRRSAASGRLSIAVPDGFWGDVSSAQPSLAVVARERLRTLSCETEIVSRAPLSAFETTAWSEIAKCSFRVDRELVSPTLADWADETFPQARLEAGDLAWRRELQNYEREVGEGFISLDRLRFWPGFLKVKKQSFALTAANEWARAQALFSPQDDRQGRGPIGLLNPTLQIVDDRAIWRVDGHLKTMTLKWQDAAAIDELRETPRLDLEQIKKELAAKRFPFAGSTDFARLIDELAAGGVILRR